MKKSLITTLLTFIVLFCYSQYYFGIKGGSNFKKINDNIGILKTDFKPGFDAGIFTGFYLTDKLYFQHEILYSNQLYTVGKLLFAPENKDIVSWNTSWITISLLAGYKIYSNNLFVLRGYLGGEFNFILENEFGYLLGYAPIDYNRPFLFGGSLGLGLDYSMFTFDISYSYGYAFNAYYNGIDDIFKLDNHYIRANVGWKFFQKGF